MTYRLADIEGRVLALLDENEEILREKMEYADPGVSVISLIRQVLPDAARIVLSTAPQASIDECLHIDSVTGGVTHLPDNRARLQLPAGFLRLLNFRMSDWNDGVTTPLACDGEEYSLRLRGHARGTRRRTRAAVAVAHRGESKTLEIFGTSSNAVAVECDFLISPQIFDETVDIPRGLLHEVCSRTAEMIKLILRYDD